MLGLGFMGFSVWGLGFKASGFRTLVWGLGFGFRVLGCGFRLLGSGCGFWV